MTSRVLKCLRLPGVRMSDQLLVEEALFRCSNDSWFLQNKAGEEGGAVIVLGISGKPKELVHLENAKKFEIPLLKRYSGGGTVFVDDNVIMNSLIVSKDFLPCDVFPNPVMKWSGNVYQRVFGPHFDTHQNDYIHRLSTADDTMFKKVAGNAQSFSKGRCVHHTSFLLEVNQNAMETFLTNPKRQPVYRAGRSHTSFLEGLREAFPDTVGQKSKDDIQDMILTEFEKEAAKTDYDVEYVPWNEETKSFLKCLVYDYIQEKLPNSVRMRSTRYINEENEQLSDIFDGKLWK